MSLLSRQIDALELIAFCEQLNECAQGAVGRRPLKQRRLCRRIHARAAEAVVQLRTVHSLRAQPALDAGHVDLVAGAVGTLVDITALLNRMEPRSDAERDEVAALGHRCAIVIAGLSGIADAAGELPAAA